MMVLQITVHWMAISVGADLNNKANVIIPIST